MLPVRIGSRDKRPLPRIDGLCSMGLDTCLDDPCYEALPLPQQLGFLNAQSLLPVEQTGLPSVQDVLALKPAACHRREPTMFAWITRDPPGADGQPGMVRALLTITCGMVEGREETYPASRSQLLVYDGKGALEVMASGQYAAVLTWDQNSSEPKLTQGYVARDRGREDWTVQSALLVATP